jgi:hypothetical protein
MPRLTLLHTVRYCTQPQIKSIADVTSKKLFQHDYNFRNKESFINSFCQKQLYSF